jgi:DNA repair exonuclease SbcCD ATPase subunit
MRTTPRLSLLLGVAAFVSVLGAAPVRADEGERADPPVVPGGDENGAVLRQRLIEVLTKIEERTRAGAREEETADLHAQARRLIDRLQQDARPSEMRAEDDGGARIDDPRRAARRQRLLADIARLRANRQRLEIERGGIVFDAGRGRLLLPGAPSEPRPLPPPAVPAPPVPAPRDARSLDARIEALEARLARIESHVQRLEGALGAKGRMRLADGVAGHTPAEAPAVGDSVEARLQRMERMLRALLDRTEPSSSAAAAASAPAPFGEGVPEDRRREVRRLLDEARRRADDLERRLERERAVFPEGSSGTAR